MLFKNYCVAIIMTFLENSLHNLPWHLAIAEANAEISSDFSGLPQQKKLSMQK